MIATRLPLEELESVLRRDSEGGAEKVAHEAVALVTRITRSLLGRGAPSLVASGLTGNLAARPRPRLLGPERRG